MPLPRVTLEMIRGEDVTLQFVVTDQNGVTVNLSAWTDIKFTLRASVSTSALVTKSIVSGGISLLSPQTTSTNTGRGEVTLDSADTLSLVAGTYYYDLLGVDDGDLRDTLIAPSKMIIERGCTE